MELLIIQSSPASRHFLPLTSKYSPRHCVLKHSQLMFFPWYVEYVNIQQVEIASLGLTQHVSAYTEVGLVRRYVAASRHTPICYTTCTLSCHIICHIISCIFATVIVNKKRFRCVAILLFPFLQLVSYDGVLSFYEFKGHYGC